MNTKQDENIKDGFIYSRGSRLKEDNCSSNKTYSKSYSIEMVDDIDDEDNEDEYDDYNSNKSVFTSVATIIIPLLVVCSIVSLTGNSNKGVKSENNINNVTIQEQQEISTSDDSNVKIDVDLFSHFKSDSNNNKKSYEEVLDNIKEEVMKGLEIDWNSLKVN